MSAELNSEIATLEFRKILLKEVKDILRDKCLGFIFNAEGLSVKSFVSAVFDVDMRELTLEALRDITKELEI